MFALEPRVGVGARVAAREGSHGFSWVRVRAARHLSIVDCGIGVHANSKSVLAQRTSQCFVVGLKLGEFFVSAQELPAKHPEIVVGIGVWNVEQGVGRHDRFLLFGHGFTHPRATARAVQFNTFPDVVVHGPHHQAPAGTARRRWPGPRLIPPWLKGFANHD